MRERSVVFSVPFSISRFPSFYFFFFVKWLLVVLLRFFSTEQMRRLRKRSRRRREGEGMEEPLLVTPGLISFFFYFRLVVSLGLEVSVFCNINVFFSLTLSWASLTVSVSC